MLEIFILLEKFYFHIDEYYIVLGLNNAHRESVINMRIGNLYFKCDAIVITVIITMEMAVR